jgi:hypothetical protein
MRFNAAQRISICAPYPARLRKAHPVTEDRLDTRYSCLSHTATVIATRLFHALRRMHRKFSSRARLTRIIMLPDTCAAVEWSPRPSH